MPVQLQSGGGSIALQSSGGRLLLQSDTAGPDPRDPCYSYRWWDRPQQLAIQFLAPNLLLTVLAVAAAAPVGARVTSRPDVVPVPIAVGWQAPYNRLLASTAQPVTIASGKVSGLPLAAPPSRVALDLPLGRNALLFDAAPTAPVGRASIDLPGAAPRFVPADLQQRPAQLKAGEVRSAQWLETPLPPAAFRPADVAPARAAIAAVAALRSAAVLDLPQPAALFRPADVSQARFAPPAADMTAAQMFGLPPYWVDFKAADLTQTRRPLNIPPFAQLDWPLPRTAPPPSLSFTSLPPPVVAAPVPLRSAQWVDIPPAPPAFRAADVAPAPIRAEVVAALRSAQLVEAPAAQAAFRPAEVAPARAAVEVAATLRSAQWFDAPVAPAGFRPADVSGVRIQAAPQPLRSAQATDLPALVPVFRPADLPANLFPLRAGEMRSAQALDIPATLPRFTPADLAPLAIPAPVVAAIRSAAQTDLPTLRPPFAATDLRNALLPRLEVFTGFPFRQHDWPLPAPAPIVDRGFSLPPFAITPAPPVVDQPPQQGGAEDVTDNAVTDRLIDLILKPFRESERKRKFIRRQNEAIIAIVAAWVAEKQDDE